MSSCGCGNERRCDGSKKQNPRLLAAFLGVSAAAVGLVAMAVGSAEPAPTPTESNPRTSPKPTTQSPAATTPEKPASVAPATAVPPIPSNNMVLQYTMTRIDGTKEDLSAYKGKVILIVNTASQCGLTPQYAGLEKLFNQKKADGLVILGFPANDFMSQEPGTDQEIATFCTSRYNVSFPMFSKVDVVGSGVHPLFAQLTTLAGKQMTDAERASYKPIQGVAGSGTPGEPTWNFTKYLIDRDGNFVQRFDPRTKPEDPAIVKKIEELLAATPKPAEPSKEHEVPKK